MYGLKKKNEKKSKTRETTDLSLHLGTNNFYYFFWLVKCLSTFGAGEEQVISCVHTQDRFGVSLSHVDTREFGAAVAPGGRHGVDDASDNTHTER